MPVARAGIAARAWAFLRARCERAIRVGGGFRGCEFTVPDLLGRPCSWADPVRRGTPEFQGPLRHAHGRVRRFGGRPFAPFRWGTASHRPDAGVRCLMEARRRVGSIPTASRQTWSQPPYCAGGRCGARPWGSARGGYRPGCENRGSSESYARTSPVFRCDRETRNRSANLSGSQTSAAGQRRLAGDAKPRAKSRGPYSQPSI